MVSIFVHTYLCAFLPVAIVHLERCESNYTIIILVVWHIGTECCSLIVQCTAQLTVHFSHVDHGGDHDTCFCHPCRGAAAAWCRYHLPINGQWAYTDERFEINVCGDTLLTNVPQKHDVSIKINLLNKA